MNIPTAELMTNKQLLQYLGISARTMTRMRGSGKFPYKELQIQIPGTSRFRYRKSDIDSWLESEGKNNDLSNDAE